MPHAMAAFWIEQEVVYGLYDGANLWEGTLGPLGSEQNLRNRIADSLREKTKVNTDETGTHLANTCFVAPWISY